MYAVPVDHADIPAQLPVPAVAVDEAALVVLVDEADPPEHALPITMKMCEKVASRRVRTDDIRGDQSPW